MNFMTKVTKTESKYVPESNKNVDSTNDKKDAPTIQIKKNVPLNSPINGPINSPINSPIFNCYGAEIIIPISLIAILIILYLWVDDPTLFRTFWKVIP